MIFQFDRYREGLFNTNCTLRSELAALKLERDELRADKERLDWILRKLRILREYGLDGLSDRLSAAFRNTLTYDRATIDAARTAGNAVGKESLPTQVAQNPTASDMVCTICGCSATHSIEDGEGVWRHNENSSKDEAIAQTFCDKYGYPIKVESSSDYRSRLRASATEGAVVKESLTTQPTVKESLQVAPTPTCPECKGTGRSIRSLAEDLVDGILSGPTANCYTCGGTGMEKADA